MTTSAAEANAPILKPKRWPLALLVAFVTGMAGAILALPVSDWAMQAHHVSNMEGGRACAAVAIYAPLAFVVGAGLGFALSLWIPGVGFAGYLKRQAVSLLVIVALVLAAGGLAYAAADHPPLVDGKPLALEIETRVPTKGRSLEELQAADFKVALVVSASDRNYSDLRWKEARQSNEYMIVPAWGRLNSKHGEREITVRTGEESGQIFNVLLPASPAVNETWSEWVKPRERFDHSKIAPEDEYLVRYRVRFAPEPAPTEPEADAATEPSP